MHAEQEHRIERLLKELLTQGECIMSAIADFSTKMDAFFDAQDKAVADIQTELKALNDQIAALQASPGTITPGDQTLLDGIQARASAVSDKLATLDTLTPPVVPVS